MAQPAKAIPNAADLGFSLSSRREHNSRVELVMKNPLSIAWGGEMRLRRAIEEQVRREFEEKLRAAQGHGEVVEIEGEMRKEVRKRLKEVASPYSLYAIRPGQKFF